METNLGAKSEFFAWNDGRRIVDLQELAKQLHCKQCSSLLDLQRTERETRYGFASVLYIHCSCGLMNDVHTSKVQQNEDSQKSSTPVFEINSRASINLLMYGSSPILSFLALLDVPVPASNDASVALPSDLASLSHVPPALPSIPTVYTPPSSTPPTKAASSSSSQNTLPLTSDPVVSSVPETLASVSGGDNNSTAVQVSCNDDGECVRDVDHREYDDHLQDNNVVSEEEDVEGFNEDVVYDEDDEEYIPPPTKVKSRLKPKPTPSSSSKKKAAPRKSRKARVKKSPEKKKPPVKRSPVKKTKPQGKVKTLKINLKNVSTESALKETEDKEVKEEVEEKGRENSRTNSDDPMEWSCEESERESAADKLSGDSQTEEEQSAKDGDEEEEEEEEARPRRKRGRPKGSADRAKRLRKSAGRVVAVGRDCEPSGEEKAVPICTACGREFNSIKGYNVHMKRVHNQDMKGARGGRAREGGPGVEPAVPEAVRAELYVCSFCCQPFARHYTALGHIRHKHWSPTLQPQARPRRRKRGKDDGGDDGSDWRCVKEEDVRECLYLCPVCHQLYSQAKCLAVHLKKVHQTAPLNVDNYGISMEGSVQKLTLAWKSLQRFSYKCLKCSKVVDHRSTFGHHIRVHAQYREVTCEALHPSQPALNFYQRELFLTQGRRKILCHTCGAAFTEKSTFLNHAEEAHGEVLREKYLCEFCSYSANAPRFLRLHYERKHPSTPRSRSHVCEVCGKAFFDKIVLEEHVNYVHLKKKEFKCPHCPKVFYRPQSFHKHKRSHAGNRPHVCSQCGQTFVFPYNLKVHERLHTGEKPFKCQQCDSAFTQKNGLDLHMKKHAKKDGGVSLAPGGAKPLLLLGEPSGGACGGQPSSVFAGTVREAVAVALTDPSSYGPPPPSYHTVPLGEL